MPLTGRQHYTFFPWNIIIVLSCFEYFWNHVSKQLNKVYHIDPVVFTHFLSWLMMPLRKCSFATSQPCFTGLNLLSYHTIRFGMHQRQSDLSRDGVWLCAESIPFLSSNSWYGFEGQEGLTFKIICPQSVMVQNRHNQACPLSLALIQGHQTVIVETESRGWR